MTVYVFVVPLEKGMLSGGKSLLGDMSLLIPVVAGMVGVRRGVL
jgi:hypothetical protein